MDPITRALPAVTMPDRAPTAADLAPDPVRKVERRWAGRKDHQAPAPQQFFSGWTPPAKQEQPAGAAAAQPQDTELRAALGTLTEQVTSLAGHVGTMAQVLNTGMAGGESTGAALSRKAQSQGKKKEGEKADDGGDGDGDDGKQQ